MNGETARPAWVYLCRCADGTYYCGVAWNPERRLAAHNAGRGARYTRGRRPVVLVYAEVWPSWGEALRRERILKRWTRARKDALVATWSGGG